MGGSIFVWVSGSWVMHSGSWVGQFLCGSVGHGSCIMGHGSIFVCVNGSLVNAYDPVTVLIITFAL